MGTNCAPLVADLFLFCYERDFMLSLSDNNQTDSQIVRAIENPSSWARVGPTTAKHQAPTNRLNIYIRAVIESEAWPTIVQLKRKP